MAKRIVPHGKNPDELRVEELIQVIQSENTNRNWRARSLIAVSMILFFWGGTLLGNSQGPGWILFLTALYLGFIMPSKFSRPSSRMSGALGEISDCAGSGAIYYLISQINCTPLEARHAVKSALSRLLPQMLAQNHFQFSHALEDQLCLCLNDMDALEHPNLLIIIIQNLSAERAPRHLAFISSLFLKYRTIPLANSLKNVAYLSFYKHTTQIVTTISSFEKLSNWVSDLGLTESWDDYIWAREEFIKSFEKIPQDLYSCIDPFVRIRLYSKIGSRNFTDRNNQVYQLDALGDSLDRAILHVIARLEDIEALPELKRLARTELLQGSLQSTLHHTIIKLETAKAKALTVKNLLHTTDSTTPYANSDLLVTDIDSSVVLSQGDFHTADPN